MRQKLAQLIPVLSVLAATPAPAESLREAWNTALEAHALIAAAEEQRAAAYRDVEGSKAERRPSLDLSSAYTRFDAAPSLAFGGFSSPPLFAGDSIVMSSAEVSLPLFAGGALRDGVTAAESAADAADWQLDTIRQDVKLRVAVAYVDVLRAESALGVADSNVATLTAHAEDARNRYESGAVPRNDYLAASVALADASQRRLRAENGLELARSAYNRLLGRDLTAAVDLEPELVLEGLVPDSPEFAALIATARAERPELAALSAQAEALKAQSAAARGAARPRVALTGGYQYLENQVLDEERFWTIGIGMEWNLFDGGRRANRSAALERRANAVLEQRADLDAAISLELRGALLDRAEAAARLRVAEQTVEQATENLAVVRDRYASGAGTNADVLDAESLRTQSLSNLDNAGFDVDLAGIRLARALGSL